MRILGIILIVGGIVLLAMRGFSYTKDRNEVNVGPLKVATEEKGFVPPIVGGIAIVAGIALVFAGRKNA